MITVNDGGVLRTFGVVSTNDGGVIRKINGVHMNDGGVMKKVHSASKSLTDLNIGDIVKIKENGNAVNYIIVHKGIPSSLYDSSCDGVWVLRQITHSVMEWNGLGTNGDNDYENSKINTWLNETFLSTIDEKIRAAIMTAKIPFKKGVGTASTGVQIGSRGLPCKVFLLSGYEVGFTQADHNICQYLPIDGAKLSYFSDAASRIAKDSRGIYAYWLLRSPHTYCTDYVWEVSSPDGSFFTRSTLSNSNVRPAFILPDTVGVDPDGNIVV